MFLLSTQSSSDRQRKVWTKGTRYLYYGETEKTEGTETMNVTDLEIKQILQSYKKFVVVGLSPDIGKPSHGVPLYMKSQGYDPAGTYPKPFEIPGIKIYPDLKSVPSEYRRFVDVFRSAENIPGIVDEVLALGGTEVLWLQLGITHPEAERRAEAKGLKVISNRCLHIEHERLLGT